MKRMFFVLLILGAFLTACDPKIDERAPRFNPEQCPVSNVRGECRTCDGSGKCMFCRGTGTRISSTKNMAGLGISLVDYETDCPFCQKTGVCDHCNGAKHCNFCGGTRQIEPGWHFLTGKRE